MGEDENSINQVKTETRKDKGDSVTFSLLARLQGEGFSEGETAVGNAEAMTLYSQSAVINEIGDTCSPPSQNSISTTSAFPTMRRGSPMPKRASVHRLSASEQGRRRKTKGQKQRRASKHINMRQAKNMMEAVPFAKSIGLHLVAHLTIHWSLTDAGDDPDGKLFAKVREGLDKGFGRRGIAFAGVWARECQQVDTKSCIVICSSIFR